VSLGFTNQPGYTYRVCSDLFAGGYLYIGDYAMVRRINPQTDQLTTIAGSGEAGPLDNGGSAKRASFNQVCTMARDQAGNLIVTDGAHNRVRVIADSTGVFYGQPMTAGHIYTIAGDGKTG
jgi:hypothetical protein